MAAVPFAAHADVKGTHVNQFDFCSRRQGRGPVRSFLIAMLLFSVALFSNGAHEILRVRYDGGERLVPFVGTVVRGIDANAGIVRVDWQSDW